MQQSFNIELLSPGRAGWSFYESLQETTDGIQTHLYCIRKAFPNCAVRAIETTTGEIVKMINGAYFHE